MVKQILPSPTHADFMASMQEQAACLDIEGSSVRAHVVDNSNHNSVDMESDSEIDSASDDDDDPMSCHLHNTLDDEPIACEPSVDTDGGVADTGTLVSTDPNSHTLSVSDNVGNVNSGASIIAKEKSLLDNADPKCKISQKNLQRSISDIALTSLSDGDSGLAKSMIVSAISRTSSSTSVQGEVQSSLSQPFLDLDTLGLDSRFDFLASDGTPSSLPLSPSQSSTPSNQKNKSLIGGIKLEETLELGILTERLTTPSSIRSDISVTADNRTRHSASPKRSHLLGQTLSLDVSENGNFGTQDSGASTIKIEDEHGDDISKLGAVHVEGQSLKKKDLSCDSNDMPALNLEANVLQDRLSKQRLDAWVENITLDGTSTSGQVQQTHLLQRLTAQLNKADSLSDDEPLGDGGATLSITSLGDPDLIESESESGKLSKAAGADMEAGVTPIVNKVGVLEPSLSSTFNAKKNDVAAALSISNRSGAINGIGLSDLMRDNTFQHQLVSGTRGSLTLASASDLSDRE
jgi:hypothetical protein